MHTSSRIWNNLLKIVRSYFTFNNLGLQKQTKNGKTEINLK